MLVSSDWPCLNEISRVFSGQYLELDPPPSRHLIALLYEVLL
jgi:hypothetical protein